MSVNNNSNNNQKAFFFLRHNNDIDHIAPVIYKWLTMEKIPTDIIITTKRSLLNDFRIKMLDNFKNANVYHFTDLFDKKNILFFRTLDDIYLFFARCKRFENFPFINKIVKRSLKEYKDNLFKGVDKAFVAFDWKTSYVIKKTIDFAKEKGFISISLPHGDNPFMSCMILTDDVDYSCKESDAPSKMFDYVVVPNYNCNKSYKIHLPAKKIKTLGSPRYCDEWLKIISEHIEPYEFGERNDNLKIVFFLRGPGYPIFWEEVIRTIKLIVQFPNVTLIVKHHPRDEKPRKMTKKLLDLYPEIQDKIEKNLRFIYGPEDSSRLLKWADMVIDIGTSVTWDSVKEKKPVLMIEYLMPSYTTISNYIEASEIKDRDKLYNIIKSYSKNKNQDFYDEEQRKKFIKEIIDVPDGNVLERYHKFLKDCLNESGEKN